MVSTQFLIIGKIIVRPNLIFKRKLLNNHHFVQSFEKLGIFINVTSYTKQQLHNINYNLLILNAYIILVSLRIQNTLKTHSILCFEEVL